MTVRTVDAFISQEAGNGRRIDRHAVIRMAGLVIEARCQRDPPYYHEEQHHDHRQAHLPGRAGLTSCG